MHCTQGLIVICDTNSRKKRFLVSRSSEDHLNAKQTLSSKIFIELKFINFRVCILVAHERATKATTFRVNLLRDNSSNGNNVPKILRTLDTGQVKLYFGTFFFIEISLHKSLGYEYWIVIPVVT